MERKTEIINNLKVICKEKKEAVKNDKKKMLAFECISSFLEEGEDFFTSANAEVAINVLMDLGYKKEDAKKLYIKLIGE